MLVGQLPAGSLIQTGIATTLLYKTGATTIMGDYLGIDLDGQIETAINIAEGAGNTVQAAGEAASDALDKAQEIGGAAVEGAKGLACTLGGYGCEDN